MKKITLYHVLWDISNISAWDGFVMYKTYIILFYSSPNCHVVLDNRAFGPFRNSRGLILPTDKTHEGVCFIFWRNKEITFHKSPLEKSTLTVFLKHTLRKRFLHKTKTHTASGSSKSSLREIIATATIFSIATES